ncbi:MAG: hypothetical protein ACOZNI_29710 [Myxococcota bacterium]
MTPDAFRVVERVPRTEAVVRVAALAEADGFAVAQATSHVAVGYRRVGVFFELPAAVGWSAPLEWSHAGLGNYHVGVVARVGDDDVRHGLSLELRAPQGREAGVRLPFWATVAGETVPRFILQGTWSVGFGGTWVARLAFGYGNDAWLAPNAFPAAEVGIAHVRPIAGPVSLVVEGELLVDPTPLSARTLARLAGEHVAVDVGVQLPVVELATEGALPQLVAQVRARR